MLTLNKKYCLMFQITVHNVHCKNESNNSLKSSETIVKRFLIMCVGDICSDICFYFTFIYMYFVFCMFLLGGLLK